MLLAPLFALALMGADAQAAPADTPVATSASSKAKDKVVLPGLVELPPPPGAPTDDFGFVSWCYGALTGHMELYKIVKPELDKLPDPKPKETEALDAEQMKAGTEYLALYRQAIDTAEKASQRPIHDESAQAVRLGYSIWGPARNAEPKTRMWSWLSWDLPGRCETSAERLYEKSLLAAEALGINVDPTKKSGSSAAAK